MARMAGSIGRILSVGLLGCTSIGLMAPKSRTAGLNRTYWTTRADRGRTGTPRATSTRLTRAPRTAGAEVDGTPRGTNSAGREGWRPSWPVSDSQ